MAPCRHCRASPLPSLLSAKEQVELGKGKRNVYKRQRKKCFPGRARLALLPFPLCLLPPSPLREQLNFLDFSPLLSGGAKVAILPTFVPRRKARTDGVAVIVEEPSDRMGARILLLARLSDVSPHRFVLGSPGSASGEEEEGAVAPHSRTTNTHLTG